MGEVLCRHESPEAAGAKVVAQMCANLELIAAPPAVLARCRSPRRAAAMRTVGAAQAAVIQRVATAAFRRAAQHEAAAEGAAAA